MADALFVVSLFLPPAVVVLGIVLLAWPRRRPSAATAPTARHAHA